ncbi:hypothetical protein HRM2_38440 [Desulforapulum autotrophicum HRM2]|uniref:Uncharacterized protein n=1 Tax=Desulforapulum autotrophicum (strain ATCC 43914 / DSM 3382 / VKM B-1955 / HRM2) TaxID=177437 RepID=C0QAW9_DESAH|nr:hypothetical protein HRM2_38440 [Desulforapulum autotrophicum HRM2]
MDDWEQCPAMARFKLPYAVLTGCINNLYSI